MSARVNAMDLEQLVGADSEVTTDQDATSARHSRPSRIVVAAGVVMGALALVASVVLFAPTTSQQFPRGDFSNTASLMSEPPLEADEKPSLTEFTITNVAVDGQTFTYETIGYVGDTLVSMIIEPAPDKEWYVNDDDLKGKTSFNMGHLNFDSQKLSSVKVSFVKNGTTDAVKIPRLAFSIYDIDSSTKGPEKVIVYGTSGHFVTKGSAERFKVTEDKGDVTVESIMYGNGTDNPSDLMNLTQEQLDKSITLSFNGITEFFMDVDLTGITGNGGRNFFFSLVNVVNDQRPDCGVVVQEFELKSVSISDDLVMTYPEVGTVDGEVLDFLVEPAYNGSWVSEDPKKSGLKADDLGKIIGSVGYTHKFKACFVKTGTKTRVNVPNFAFTIYDIDCGKDGPERYVVRGPTSFATREPLFFAEQKCNAVVARCLVKTGGENNPTSTDFTKEQIQLSLTTNFEDTSTFKFDFDLSQLHNEGNQRFMFFTLLRTIDTCAKVMNDDI